MQANPADPPTPKRSKKLTIVVVVAVAAAIAVAVPILSPSLLTVHDSGAIAFGASMNATSISQNQTLRVDVSVRNGLHLTNAVPLSGDWKVQNLTMGPCSFYENHPYGIAVYQGTYGLNNLSSGSQLQIYAPGFYSCGTVTVSNTFTLHPQQNVSSYVELRGYWTAGETPQPGGGSLQGVLHPFVPGFYTLVAGDEWGHVKILHFVVACPFNCSIASAQLIGQSHFNVPVWMATTSTSLRDHAEGWSLLAGS